MIGSREDLCNRRLALGLAVLVTGLALSGTACNRKDDPIPGDVSKDVPLAGSDAPADPATATTVGEVLETSRHSWLRWPDLADVAAALVDLYSRESDRLVWFEGERALPAVEEAIDALSRAAEHALQPSDYDAERIQAERKRLSAKAPVEATERALFDLALSIGVLREIQAVRIGRVDPRTLDWGYDVRPKKLDRAALLLGARDGAGVSALLESLEPSFPHYKRNRKVLAHYRSLARAGEPAPVPSLPKGRRKVALGEPWVGVPQMRARLRVFGDLEEDRPTATTPDATPLYDAALVDAVKRFQRRHLLDADGVVGSATIEALNVPLSARVRQLELAMERGRWLPPLGDRPTVFVNVPIFRLWASDPVRGEEVLRMNVVVGKSLSHHTPLFVQEMEYVVFRPYWNPTYGIVTEEILPKARRDLSYLEAERFEIVASGDDDAPVLPATPENLDAVAAGRLYVRQKPGPRNSLGLAKFIFPNRENIYMHGTPAPHLFARTRRDFSHGCIRLEDPAGLAEWVLRDVPGWTRERIDAAMQAERPTRVNLREPLRVVIFYDTVHVNSENVVHFVGDIYGHDRALDEALERGYPYPEES
jgi:murein L,D-transpeptidase YcbB/YkuD